MDGADDVAPPAGLLTGGNAQEFRGYTSRHFSMVTRCSDSNPRLPPLDTPECSNQQRDVAGTVDASSLGFEKIMSRLDRLESRWEAIDRCVIKLHASRAAYGQQHYVDFYFGSRRRRTCWDPPFRTSGCRVGEIRAPPLPELPPQPVPELFYGSPHRGTSDTPVSKHTTRPSLGPWGFLHADSAVSS